jgi:hypothetical protein
VAGAGISAGERARVIAWAGVAACVAVGWNVFIWKADLSDAAPKRLLVEVGVSLATLGVLGGLIVPRRRASWRSLLFECGACASAVGLACFLTAAWISAAKTDDNPLALGFWGVFWFIASAVLMTPFFLGLFAVRAGVLYVVGQK